MPKHLFKKANKKGAHVFRRFYCKDGDRKLTVTTDIDTLPTCLVGDTIRMPNGVNAKVLGFRLVFLRSRDET